MQNIKDSFYIALRDRLAVVNPSRTVAVQGASRPAIVVAENEIATDTQPSSETFYLSFQDVSVSGTERAGTMLVKLKCEISYWTQGSDASSGQDRGRTMGTLGDELMAIMLPMQTEITDFTQTPPADTGAALFWTIPVLGKVTETGRMLSRIATTELYSLLEVNAQ